MSINFQMTWKLKAQWFWKKWIIRLDGVGIGIISIYDLTENPFIFLCNVTCLSKQGIYEKGTQNDRKAQFAFSYYTD